MFSSKVSVIIPLYNQSKQLMDCLASIKDQTIGEGVEVIIVNDGSTDITHSELEQKVASCLMPTVSCRHQNNQGAPSARNNGYQGASGEYILFCDADVVMMPLMLEAMAAVLDEHHDVSYAYSSFKFGWKTFTLWPFNPEKLKEMPYIHSTSLVRRKALEDAREDGAGPWDAAVERLQDWDLWLTLLEHGHAGQWIDMILFSVKPGGTMSAWMPALFTKIGFGKRYNDYKKAVEIIKKKHGL